MPNLPCSSHSQPTGPSPGVLVETKMDSLPDRNIRLLHLKSGLEADPVVTDLVHASLNNLPSYEALSYTWGSTEKDNVISCNGRSFNITQHLLAALCHLRRNDGQDRVLWVDLLCIDQESDAERTEQVGFMKDIYAGAEHVLIWLGEEESSDVLAYGLLQQFDYVLQQHGHVDYSAVNNITSRLGLPMADSEEWRSLVKLFQRAWFQRIWVIQEAVTARHATVACGPRTVDLDLILRVALAVRKNGMLGAWEIEGHAPGVYSALLIHELKALRENGESLELLELLRRTKSYLATDPRDKVFALIGLASDGKRFERKVDYSLQTDDVYAALAAHALVEQKDLTILSSCGLHLSYHSSLSSSTSEAGISQLPSWVPDWRLPNDWKFPLGTIPYFQVINSSLSKVSPSIANRTLTLHGLLIDVVSHINEGHRRARATDYDPTQPESQAERFLREKAAVDRSWALISQHADVSRLPPDHTLKEAFWRTLTCDLTPLSHRADKSYGEGFYYLQRMLDALDEKGNVDWGKVGRAEIALIKRSQEFLHGGQMWSLERNVAITQRGYVSRVPHTSIVGDMVAVLYGARVPFVLREIEGKDGKGTGRFRLIGECYVHGLMDGQIMTWDNLEHLEREFRIE